MTYDEPEFRQVSLDSYPDLDLTYYRENSEFLEKQGFSYLGEIEDVVWARKNKNLQTCLRVLTGDEGTIQAMIYHVQPKGLLKIAKYMLPQLMRGIDLETEFSDGFFLHTTNSMPPPGKPDIEVRCEPEASLEELLDIHLEKYLADYEQPKQQKTSSLHSSGTSNPVGAIFVYAILIFLYELVGKTAEVGTQLVISKKIPLESHIPLHISWLVIWFFGGSLMWARFILPKLQDADTLVMLAVVFAAPVLIVFLITRLFKTIPVHCPKCGGQAYWTENKPVPYTCRECNHIHRAGISYGSAR